jgi:hypothetical protein
MAMSTALFGALAGQTIKDTIETAIYGELKTIFIKMQALVMQKVSGANALKAIAQM